jgi:hypothetical protein
MWSALSDEKTGLLFTIVVGPRQRSHSHAEPHGTHDHILLSQIRDSPVWRAMRFVYGSKRPHNELKFPTEGVEKFRWSSQPTPKML